MPDRSTRPSKGDAENHKRPAHCDPVGERGCAYEKRRYADRQAHDGVVRQPALAGALVDDPPAEVFSWYGTIDPNFVGFLADSMIVRIGYVGTNFKANVPRCAPSGPSCRTSRTWRRRCSSRRPRHERLRPSRAHARARLTLRMLARIAASPPSNSAHVVGSGTGIKAALAVRKGH